MLWVASRLCTSVVPERGTPTTKTRMSIPGSAFIAYTLPAAAGSALPCGLPFVAMSVKNGRREGASRSAMPTSAPAVPSAEDDLVDTKADPGEEVRHLPRRVFADVSHVAQRLELLVLSVNARRDGMALVAEDQVSDTAERPEVGSRKEQQSAGLQHPVDPSEREDRVDTEVLKQFAEQNDVKGLRWERHCLGLDIALGDIEAKARDRHRESLRLDVHGADLVLESRERGGHHERYRPVLQNSGAGLDVSVDEIKVRGESVPVLLKVL